MGFGGQFQSTEFVVLWIWRLLPPFLLVWLWGPSVVRAGPAGLQSGSSGKCPRQLPDGKTEDFKNAGGLACQESFDCSARSPADRNIGRFGTSRRHPRRQLRRRQPRRKATSKKATSKERASDILFLIAIAAFQLGGGGLKIGRLLTLNTRP